MSDAPVPPARPAPASGRALDLLASTRTVQEGLPPAAALAWERAAFREAFLDPEPGRRIRAFLDGDRQGPA